MICLPETESFPPLAIPQKRRVLVVEDNSSELLIFRVACQNLPWSIRFASSAAQVLHAVANPSRDLEGLPWSDPELIILDLHPGADCGVELLQSLREIDTLERVPIVTWSCSRDPVLIDQIRKAGGTHFAEKPFDFKALTALLELFHSRWLNSP